LLKIFINFLGNCRFELEEFDLHKGRYFQFLKGPGQVLSEDEQDALSVFQEINKTLFVTFLESPLVLMELTKGEEMTPI
jgi:hypothetical protein